MATLMSDEVFHEVAYRARNRSHILAGVDEFLDAVSASLLSGLVSKKLVSGDCVAPW